MTDALIGCTGYVGTTLGKQRPFAAGFHSTDIDQIDGREFDLVVCAGAPAQKWIANKAPDEDRRGIQGLVDHLRTIRCRQFVLISTVDVFARPVEVDESSPVEEAGLHAYGLNRRLLEREVARIFPRHLIVRLPGLVGPGLRKNAVYDLLNDNNVQAIDSRGVFQFYPMVNLWADVETGLAAGLELLHLTAAPLSVADIASQAFGRAFDNPLSSSPARYDFRTRHATAFGGHGHYQYDRRESLLAIRAYAQGEPRQAPANGV